MEGNRTASKVFNLWPALLGVVVGAAVVGTTWGIAAAHPHQNDPLVASVGHKQIRKSDFQAKMESLAGLQTVQQMVDNQLILDGAKAKHLAASKQDLSQALQNFELQYRITGSAQLQQFLKSNGLTRPQLDEILTVNILEQKLAQQGITVSNKEIQTYYNKNKTAFVTPGSKNPKPLSAVRSQIIAQIKQSKAVPRATLLANLAKTDPVKIYDSKYSSVEATLQPSVSNQSAG